MLKIYLFKKKQIFDSDYQNVHLKKGLNKNNLMRKNMTRVQVSQVSGHYFLAIQSMDST